MNRPGMTSTVRRGWGAACLAGVWLTGCGQLPVGSSDGGTTSGSTLATLHTSYLGECAACHAPGAAGKTRDTEQSLDFSTVATTAATLKGNATGLVGNFSGCNGVPFIVPGHPAQSLLVASLDQSTRKAFSAAGGACDESAISDMTVKLAPAPAGFVEALKAWITEGAPSN